MNWLLTVRSCVQVFSQQLQDSIALSSFQVFLFQTSDRPGFTQFTLKSSPVTPSAPPHPPPPHPPYLLPHPPPPPPSFGQVRCSLSRCWCTGLWTLSWDHLFVEVKDNQNFLYQPLFLLEPWIVMQFMTTQRQHWQTEQCGKGKAADGLQGRHTVRCTCNK